MQKDVLLLLDLPQSTVARSSHESHTYHQLKKILRENNLLDIRFHNLWQTFATASLEHGMDVKTLSPIWPGGKKHACNGCGRMKTHQAPGAHTPEACFSVCGLLCGQRVDHLSLLSQNTTKRKEKSPFSYEKGDFLELLGGFEPPTSSLPTGWEPSSPCIPTLSGPFCSKRMRSAVLFAPLFPSVRFPVWVTVWVKQLSGRERGAHLRQR